MGNLPKPHPDFDSFSMVLLLLPFNPLCLKFERFYKNFDCKIERFVKCSIFHVLP